MARDHHHIRLNISHGNQLTELYNNVQTGIDKCNKLKFARHLSSMRFIIFYGHRYKRTVVFRTISKLGLKFTKLVKCGYIFDTDLSEVVPYAWGQKKVPLYPLCIPSVQKAVENPTPNV